MKNQKIKKYAVGGKMKKLLWIVVFLFVGCWDSVDYHALVGDEILYEISVGRYGSDLSKYRTDSYSNDGTYCHFHAKGFGDFKVPIEAVYKIQTIRYKRKPHGNQKPQSISGPKRGS